MASLRHVRAFLLGLLLVYILLGRTPLVSEEERVVETVKETVEETRWAVLVAGSRMYQNYRHQADVCHAYQVLKKGGLKDENIIVMMYDDIAENMLNPRPGVIVREWDGDNVYAGVPKDYTGDNVTADNLYAVLLGNKKLVKGGTGKVVDSRPGDRIFLFYSDHGRTALLPMPNFPNIGAKELIEVLKKMHSAGTYKGMLIYVEACGSGSMFRELPENISIYAVTASNPNESSRSMNCILKYGTCLADEFSLAWMGHSETHNLDIVSIGEQFEEVKNKTLLSHVSEYGDKRLKGDKVSWYLGNNPESTSTRPRSHQISLGKLDDPDVDRRYYSFSQEESGLMMVWLKYIRSSGSKRAEALEEIRMELSERAHVDGQVGMIGVLLFGSEQAHSILYSHRDIGLPVVDDFECYMSRGRFFEKHCGVLSEYGLKHALAFANICNHLVSREAFEEAVVDTCGKKIMTLEYSF